MKLIETIALDKDEYVLYENDSFDTIKEAKAWVKDTLLDQSWWNRLTGNDAYALDIYTIQLRINGEIHSDWFPEFKPA